MADKEATIVLHMSAELKATIATAAERLGVSVATFITDTALKRALQLQHASAGDAQEVEVPAYFRDLCEAAMRGAPHGFTPPGWHLATLMSTQRAVGMDDETWSRAVDALKALLANRDDEAAWVWFREYFPHCMALVPPRRREQFLYGVHQAYEQDLINAG